MVKTKKQQTNKQQNTHKQNKNTKKRKKKRKKTKGEWILVSKRRRTGYKIMSL